MDGFGNVINEYTDYYIFQRGVKGEPGIGFKLTNDNNFDIENKRLCNTQDPEEDSDACTRGYVSNRIQQVENKVHTDTSLINATITTKFKENNLKLKEFSDNTERFINLKHNSINKKLEKTENDLNKKIKTLATGFLNLHKSLNDLVQVFANNTNKIVTDNYSAINKKTELTKEDFLDFVKTFNTSLQIFATNTNNISNLNINTIKKLME